jgi:hypothetical protein
MFMLRRIKISWLALMILLCCAQSGFGFALLGPFNEAYQVNVIGYNLVPPQADRVDLGGPKNIGQGYRWNTRNLYYAFDAQFFNYFGSDGAAAAAVDQAFGVLNNLTNLSAYPHDLGDLPLDTTRFNYRALALNLIDVKSQTLALLMEELGLAEPERYTWCLHNRFLPAGATCPNYIYEVIQRNFDPVTDTYSSYVNGNLYSYIIAELCGLANNPVAPFEADALEYTVDPAVKAPVTSVAGGEVLAGMFYTGLTKDDVGGLRYLLATNRINWENSPTNAFRQITNNSLQLLETSNLNFLAAAALTNPPATLQGLFPGLVINSFTQGFSNIVTTNIFAYITNFNFSPPGNATLVVGTNFTTNVIPVFFYQFGNVITNNLYANGLITIQTISNGVPPFSPPGTTPVSITNNQTFEANFPNGSYFLLPTNALCGFSIVSTQLITVTPITNVTVTATSAPGTVNSNNISFTESIITYSTNYFLIVSIPQCSNTNGPALYEGVDKLNFFRRDFDSLLSQLWTPITNSFTLTTVSNDTPSVQTFFRVVTQPDFLFTAADIASGPAARLFIPAFLRTAPNFNQPNAPAPGPGTIDAPVLVTFNSVGLNFSFILANEFFVDNTGLLTQFPGAAVVPEGNGVQEFQFASFDGSTNAPVVYPSSVALADLENQVFLQILLSGPLPAGNANVPYSAQLEASGFQPPFTWSLAANSLQLPPGLSNPVPPGADTSVAVISGTPTVPGIYDFAVQVQDSAGRKTQRNFTIEIDP